MSDTSGICTVFILLSASKIIFSITVTEDYSNEIISTSTITHTSPVPEEVTTELQNVQVCETGDQLAECAVFLEGRLNKDSEEYRQLQFLKRLPKAFQSSLPHQAAIGGFIELIKVLLHNGVPVNKQYYFFEETMLHVAAFCGHNDLVTFLLTQGADTQVKNSVGDTPLHLAASKFRATTVQLLLDAGAQVNVANEMGETPLFQIVKNFHPPYYSEESKIREYLTVKNIIELLFEHGADANIANNQQITPLHIGAEVCNSTIVKLLKDGGGNIDATDDNNQTPLHKAAESNNVSVVEYLITIGADKTITDSDKKTALDIAREKNFTEIVDLLSRETFYHVVSL